MCAAAMAGLLVVAPGPLAAQTALIQVENAPFFTAPAGVRIARIARTERFVRGQTRDGHTEVTLEGWIFRNSVTADSRDGRDLRVTAEPEENLRAEPNGRIVARLTTGALLDEVERRGNWIRVRRTGWVQSTAFGEAPAAAAPVPPRTQPAATPPATRPAATGAAPPAQSRDTQPPPADLSDPRRAVSRRRLNLHRAPDSSAIGTLEAGSPLRVTARAGDWVRIETQAWVRESEIRLSDAGILSNVSAAELRGAPDEFRGRLLRWTIQYIALQTADDLRPDFAPGQRYILARGPAPEYAFVYILVPADRLPEIQRLEPLASVTVIARVVAGRSQYLANPILELVELQP